MTTIKTIIIGVFIWILGISFYSICYYIPVLENEALQANLILAIALVPSVWLGAHLLYKWNVRIHGFQTGAVLLLTAIMLDALITVPYFIIPYGGSYQTFFGSLSFWLIACEFLLVMWIYWKLKVRVQLL